METYRPSGAIPPVGAVMTLIAGLTAASVLGVAYVYFVNWVPLIYFNFFATLAFGVLAGLAVTWASRLGKLRNPALLFVLGLTAGLFGLYVAWAFDPKARFYAEFLAFDPEVLWRYIQVGYEKGFWTIGRHARQNVSGKPLAAVWIIEAAIIVGGAALVALGGSSHPFCEQCNRWAETQQGVRTLANVPNDDPSLAKLLEGDLSGLASMPRAASPTDDHLRLDVTRCPACEECNFVSVSRVATTTNSKGETETSTNELLTHLIVSPNEVQLVLDAGIEPKPAEE